MIEIKNIEKSFGDTKILKGVSTVFETGKTNLIIGKSGSGKTVLLVQMILDVYKDSQGVLTLHSSKIGLRNEIRKYFQERNEDGIDK